MQPLVSNYNSLYKKVESMAWEDVPNDVKVEVVREIKKVLEAILVAE